MVELNLSIDKSTILRGEMSMNINTRKKQKTDKMLLRNNERKMCGLPLHRKKSKKRRYLTRCEAEETIGAFLDYCNRD